MDCIIKNLLVFLKVFISIMFSKIRGGPNVFFLWTYEYFWFKPTRICLNIFSSTWKITLTGHQPASIKPAQLPIRDIIKKIIWINSMMIDSYQIDQHARW